MSEQELYDIARHQIDRRRRRYWLLGINAMLWLAFIALRVGFPEVIQPRIGTVIIIIWMGLLGLHGISILLALGREEAIEGQVEHLRRAIHDEKPKRLELGADGELVEVTSERVEVTDDEADQKRKRVTR
ncbi:MAG: hypothetical protein U0670_17570 [Anaerolineae bacterium]